MGRIRAKAEKDAVVADKVARKEARLAKATQKAAETRSRA